MQNDDTPSPAQKKRPARSCCLLALTVCLVGFLLAVSGIACIITLDTINLRGENHTLSWRVQRYKVACQFIWFDFKDWFSRTFSEQPPSEPEPEAEP